MNHLLVIYAFLLPISSKAKSQVLIVILLLFLFRRNFWLYLKPSISNPIVQAFIMFFLLYVLWLFGTENLQYANRMISQIKYALLPLLFLSFLDKKFSTYIISAFILGMLYSEIFSYLINFNILPWTVSLFDINIYQAYLKNDPSPFLHHSHYAAALALTVALLANQLLTKTNTVFVKIMATLFMISATVNMSLVGGRIGYIIYIVLLTSLIIIKYKKKAFKPLLLLSTLLVLVFTIAYSFSPLFKQRIDYSLQTIEKLEKNNSVRSSLGNRITIWNYSSDIIKENPLFGVGTGDLMDEVRKNITSAQHQHIKNMPHTHNQYISILLQFGIIGLFVFLNIFYQIFHFKQLEIYNREVMILTTLTIGLAVTTDIFYIYKFYLPLWVVLVSASIASKEYISNTSQPLINKKVLTAYMVLISLSLLIAFVYSI